MRQVEELNQSRFGLVEKEAKPEGSVMHREKR